MVVGRVVVGKWRTCAGRGERTEGGSDVIYGSQWHIIVGCVVKVEVEVEVDVESSVVFLLEP
jgi:hypothetical protein